MRRGFVLVLALLYRLWPSVLHSAELPGPNLRLSAFGQVVDPEGKPVPGATVYLRQWPSVVTPSTVKRAKEILATAVTDEQGGFALRDVPAPGYADIPGMGKKSFPWDLLVRARGSLAFKPLTRKNQAHRISLVLAPAASLRGRLVDSAGKPLGGVRLEVTDLIPLHQRGQTFFILGYGRNTNDSLFLSHSQFQPTTRSDEQGRFVLSGLPGGVRVNLTVADERFARQSILAATTDEPQGELTENNGRESRQIPVHIGDFTVTLQPGRRLHGRVLLADSGKPAGGTSLSIHVPGRSISFDPVTADSEGRYSFAGLPACVSGLVAYPTPDGPYLGTSVTCTIPQDNKELQQDVRLSPGIPVTGKVVDQATGRGIAGVELGQMQLPGGPAGAPNRDFPTGSLTKRDGSFRLMLPPGKHQLGVAIAQGYVIPAVWGSNTGAPANESPQVRILDIKPGQPVTGVIFALERSPVLELHVVDSQGKAVHNALVHHSAGPFLEVLTDEAGKATITDLNPGQSYELEITHDARKLAAKVAVEPARDSNKPVAMEVKLLPGGSVAGRVVGEDGKPIPEALIQPQRFASSGSQIFRASIGRSVRTDRNGRYTIDGLMPGSRYKLQASLDGYSTMYGPRFDSPSGQVWQAPDIVLARANDSVAGVVLDGRGKPLAGVWVQAASLGRVNIRQPGAVYTDKEGRFRIAGLPKGATEVTTGRPGGRPNQPIRVAQARVPAGKQDIRLVLIEDNAGQPGATVGKPTPEFVVETWLHHDAGPGRGFLREDYRGKVVLLAFLDEAKPSRRPLERLGRLAGEGMVVLRIYELPTRLEDRTRMEEELRTLSPLPAALVAPGLVSGGYSEAFAAYGVRATPALFLLDRQGVLRYADLDSSELEARVGELLKR
jgi:protocatechuate 3,4-dioxygenase beta subunit